MSKRHILLALALVVTLVAAFWPRQEGGDGDIGVVEALPAKKPLQSRGQDLPKVATGAAKATDAKVTDDKAGSAKAETQRFPRLAGDLFPVQTWAPPPPKPKPKPYVPPPPPAPPPLPFTYLGQWLEEGDTVYFLTTKDDRVFPVRPGEVVMNSWRLDKANEDLLVFTYLPLDMPKTIRIAR